MKNVNDLIQSAASLAAEGFSKGEIADELNVSRETASWLVDRSTDARAPRMTGPGDIHVDWSAIGRSSRRLGAVGRSIADLLDTADDGVEAVVGVEKAGTPLATIVASDLDVHLGTYTPRKHHWEEGDIEDLAGGFSHNFADIGGHRCYIVDDTITTGTTMSEAVKAVRDRGGTPVACGVLVDKRGIEMIEEVPVKALVRVIRVGE